jgi:uncharacterized protein (TIGR03435 family)
MVRVLAVAAVSLATCSAQPPGVSRPRFELATIKLNKSGSRGMMISPRPGGRFVARNSSLESLIAFAYQIDNFQFSGAPDWLNSERYDIEAKAFGNLTSASMRPMLQALLEDRLQLKFHHETKEEPVYALLVRKTGKLNDAGECSTPPGTTPPPPKPGEPPPPGCGSLATLRGRIIAEKIPVGRLVAALASLTERMVLDETNLTCKYDIDLRYAPDMDTPGQTQADPNSPSLFTALQEQLGLKLESRKGPVEKFVIDHVERPSGN